MPGITVSGGRLYFRGKRLRAVGLNWGGAVFRIYSQTQPNVCAFTPAAEQDAFIAFAKSIGAPVVRMKGFPFYPSTTVAGVFGGKAWNAFTVADMQTCFGYVDAFFEKLLAAGMCAIVTLNFRFSTVPDIVGETSRQWLNTGSNTWAVMTTMNQAFVARYSQGGARADLADALGGIAWGNETNQVNDIAQADVANMVATGTGIFATNVGYGTAASYSRTNDALTTGDTYGVSDLGTLLSRWSGVISAADPHGRLQLSGGGPCSFWRPDQSNGVVQPLNRFMAELVRDNPLNSVCYHHYGGYGYSSFNSRGLSSVLVAARTAAKQAGKAFVLEEFGNQPRKVNNLTVANGVATMTVGANWAAEVGDVVRVVNEPGYNGDYTITALPGGQNAPATLSAPAGIPNGTTNSGTGRVQHLVSQFGRIVGDIEAAQVDLSLLWCYESDPNIEIGQSITHACNAWQIPLIAAANERLASATW